jgi:pyruvate/2-oxoglutarate dehydrogenase complex dihydrolipoamide acyltransferase (E2) component
MTLRSKLTGWRKIAHAMWGAPNDPQIFGALDIDATRLVDFMNRCRAAGHRITPTHLVGRAVAHALREVPDLNVRIVGEHAVQRPSVEIFFITAVKGGRDLSGVKVERAEVKSVFEISEELTARSRTMKGTPGTAEDPRFAVKADRGFAKTKNITNAMPGPILRQALRLSAWITGEHAKSIESLSLAASPFGSAMVTNVGMFGLPMGFAPLSWMYRVPLLVLAGEIIEKPVAIEGRVEVRPILPLSATIDHRYVDGWHLSQLMKPFRDYLADPERHEPAIGLIKKDPEPRA